MFSLGTRKFSLKTGMFWFEIGTFSLGTRTFSLKTGRFLFETRNFEIKA